MKKKYTHQDIDSFFEQFKALPEYYDLEKVHQLIDNPDAKAMHSVKMNFNLLKIIVMSSISVIVLVSLFYWFVPLNTAKEAEIIFNNDDMRQSSNVPLTKPKAGNDLSVTKNGVSKNKEIDRGATKALEFPKKERSHEAIVKQQETQLGRQLKTLEKLSPNTFDTFLYPKDTVIEGSKFFVTLSDQELEKLGFMLDETGIYYKNEFEGEMTSFYSYHNGKSGEISAINHKIRGRNLKADYSHLNFYPMYFSDMYYRFHQLSDAEFEKVNDTLIPVIIKSQQHKFDADDRIIWFKTTDDFFDHLPIKYYHLRSDFEQIQNAKKMNSDVDLVKYESEKLIGNFSFLELSKGELEEIGISENEGAFYYQQGGDCAFRLMLSPKMRGIQMLDSTEILLTDIKLVFISNSEGEQEIKWKCDLETEDKLKTSYFQLQSELLVPVMLKQSEFPEILQDDKIFWFEPTDSLFKHLPENIGSQLMQEYNYLSAPNSESSNNIGTSCTFFEACKSTLQIHDLTVYPNPASSVSRIEFNLPQAMKGSISLKRIDGKFIKVLLEEKELPSGLQSYPLALEDIKAGMYLVSLHTDNGSKTFRIMVSP